MGTTIKGVQLQPVENSQPCIVEVNIWDTDHREGRCGHASVQLIDSKNISKYVGMWPKFPVFVNFFTLLLVSPGVFLKSKEDCMERESVELDQSPLHPNRVIRLPVSKNDFKKMSNLATDFDQKIKKHMFMYCLFPNFNLLNALKSISMSKIASNVWGECPISGIVVDNPQLIEDLQMIQQIKVGNCTTVVSEILNAGGFNTNHEGLPWGVSPTGLANQLENIASKIEGSSIERY